MPTTPVAQSDFFTGIFDKLPILEAATTVIHESAEQLSTKDGDNF